MLIPLYVTGGMGASQFDSISLTNVTMRSPHLWGPFVGVFLSTFVLFWGMDRVFSEVRGLRACSGGTEP